MSGDYILSLAVSMRLVTFIFRATNLKVWIFIKPSVELMYMLGGEKIIAALTDVLYHGYNIKSALSKVDEKLVGEGF